MSRLFREISPVKKGNFTNAGFSIICAYNDYEKLEKYLIGSLNRQHSPYELLTVDNHKGLYSSAASILNQTAYQARYDYLLFVHQDVALLSDTWLIDVQSKLSSLKHLGAVGVAGKTDKGVLWSSVIHGDPPAYAGPRDLLNTVEVQTLDGCLIIVPRIIFERVPFDESHKGWYLYVAGYCLDLLRNGYKSYVVPDLIYHASTGASSPIFYEEAVRHLVRRHKSSVEAIYTTMGEWLTNRELEPTSEQLADRGQSIHQLKVDLVEPDQEVLSYALSNSWRITRPLRKFWKLLKGNKVVKINNKLKNLKEYILIKRSGLFDPYYYYRHYPDVRRADINPLMHYICYGWKEGRNPSELFDTNFYLSQNQDVRDAGGNPLTHYLNFGRAEGRDPMPHFFRQNVVTNPLEEMVRQRTPAQQ